MNAEPRVLFRVILCAVFIASLYGGMTLLTAAMFASGHMVLAIVSGVVLTSMTATALALIGLAWAMVNDPREDDMLDMVAQPG